MRTRTVPAVIWERGHNISFFLEGRFGEDMVLVLMRCNPLHLGRRGSAKTQCLLFLEGRFGEDTHSACRYLGAKAQCLLFLKGRFGEDMVPPFMRFNSLHLGRRGSAKTQYLLFLEGRFGEDKHSACRFLGDGSGRSRRPPYRGRRIQRGHSVSFF